jgi:uncharacterized protein (TIGR00106 family)
VAVADVRVVPVGGDGASMAAVVARAYRVAQKSGLRHELTPTATVLEGETAALLDTARRMHEAALAGGATRVVTSVTVDERRDAPVSMGRMVASVMADLARELTPV